MGSRLFDEIREQRGLAYSVSAFPHAYADVGGAAAVGRTRVGQVHRGLPPDARHRHRAARGRPDRGRGRARPRVRRRRSGDRVREQRRGRALRRPADDRVRRGRRPRSRRSRCSTRSRSTRSERSPRGVAGRARRSPASGRTPWRSWSSPETLARRRRRLSRSRVAAIILAGFGGGQPHQQARRSGQRRAAGALAIWDRRGPAAAGEAAQPARHRPRRRLRTGHRCGPPVGAALAATMQTAGPESGALVYDLDAHKTPVRGA